MAERSDPSFTPSVGDFARVDSHVSLPEIDRRVLDRWDAIDGFAVSISNRAGAPEYTFYDGPPFANGSPHYGHLLQAAIKDIVPRYWTMRGFRVERRFGWDTHGLPVEMEVEKQLGVSGPRQIHEFGVASFNEACRDMVNTTTEDWEVITRRIGRWVDFNNDYKTMDIDFMESVWWVFKSLWDKDLVYSDLKVLPYSYGAATPLSNFEANLNYKSVVDPSITVRLEILEDHGPLRAGDHLMIWTTTPWTLPSNLAVAVGEDVEYVGVDGEIGGTYSRHWLARERVDAYYALPEIVATASGADLVGALYQPPFDYFREERSRGAFQVIPSGEVVTTEGTGLVHMAPAYGEADFYALLAAGLNVLVDPVDAEARFTGAVPEVAGQNVKDADKTLVALLKASGKLVKHDQIQHSYPFCWRTDTPLIYKAIPTWFVRVESIRDRMRQLNEKVRWVPDAVGAKRFGNWLENARDWAVSRNRYWGSCIPVWNCDSCGEQRCVGSRQELYDISAVMVEDLHKHVVDEITFACSSCSGTMIRVPEVLDCWFESGSMPYAQIHYPFENSERFEERYPAEFIAEGLDQTRGWFYTLVVLGTALQDEIPFKNCVVTGMILTEDGRKMSKSLKNYDDPTELLDEFGADALRAYMINSPLVRADPLRFSTNGVREVVRTVLLPLWNAVSFFLTYAEADGISRADISQAPPIGERSEIDRWIVSVLQTLVRDVNREMEEYRLYAVVPPMLGFIDHLTNWYIRRSRRRFWAHREEATEADKLATFATLYEVLVTFTKVAAPIIPFITDEIYSRLTDQAMTGFATVHHEDYPVADEAVIESDLEGAMAAVREIVGLGRGLRKQHNLPIRQPLSKLTVATRSVEVSDAVLAHIDLIADELNVRQVGIEANERDLVVLSAKANYRVLGPRFGSGMKAVAADIGKLDNDEIVRLLETGSIEVAGHLMARDDIVVERHPRQDLIVASVRDITVVLDCNVTLELAAEGYAREFINRAQGLRRRRALEVTDRIELSFATTSEELAAAFHQHRQLISDETLSVALTRSDSSLVVSDTIGGHGLEFDLRSV